VLSIGPQCTFPFSNSPFKILDAKPNFSQSVTVIDPGRIEPNGPGVVCHGFASALIPEVELRTVHIDLWQIWGGHDQVIVPIERVREVYGSRIGAA